LKASSVALETTRSVGRAVPESFPARGTFVTKSVAWNRERSFFAWHAIADFVVLVFVVSIVRNKRVRRTQLAAQINTVVLVLVASSGTHEARH